MKGTIFAVALNHRSQLDAWRDAFNRPLTQPAEDRGLVYQTAQYRHRCERGHSYPQGETVQSGATVALIVGKTARKVSAADAASLSPAMRWPMTSACRKRASTARRLRPNVAMASAPSAPSPGA